MEALRYKPVAFYRLDDTSPFQDYSGYNNTATMSGTESHGLALTADAAFSQRFYTSNYGVFNAPVYVKNRESANFSICATIYPVISTAGSNQQIVSHSGQYDGISLNGTVVSFSTVYSNSGSATCSYDFKIIQKVNVVGVHTSAKNMLYVNGVLVDEVDLTDAQKADTYAVTDPAFYCGYSTGTQKVLINNIGFFSQALQTRYILAMYAADNRVVEGSIPKALGGEDVFVGGSVRHPSLDTGWYSENDWNQATLFGAVVDNDELTSQMDNGLTLGAVWIDSVDLYSGETPLPINSINLWWEGENETVEASVDNGNTWVNVVKGQNLSNINTGFDPTDKALNIRITLAAGVDEAYVSYMRVRAYATNSATVNNKVITYTNPVVVNDDKKLYDLRDDTGANISTGGAVTINPDVISQVPTKIMTIEVWMKPGSTSPTTTATGSFTNYVNGVLNGTAKINEWNVYHYVAAAQVTSAITISGGTGIVGKVAIYPIALTQSQISIIVANYTGVNKVRYDGSGSIGLSESNPATVIYAHDWAISTA